MLNYSYPLTVNEAYIIGALLGDGEVRHYEHAYRIRFWNKDKEFANQFFNALCTFKTEREGFWRYGLRGCRSSPSLKFVDNRIYIVQWDSKEAYQLITNKIGKLESNLLGLGKKRVAAFLKGLYDAKGNYWYKGNHHRVNIYNTNPKIINLAEDSLRLLAFEPYKYIQHRNHGEKDLCCLRIIGKGNVQRFFQWVRPIDKKMPPIKILPRLNKLGQKRYALIGVEEVARSLEEHKIEL